MAGAFIAGAFIAGAFIAGAFIAGAFMAGAFIAGSESPSAAPIPVGPKADAFRPARAAVFGAGAIAPIPAAPAAPRPTPAAVPRIAGFAEWPTPEVKYELLELVRLLSTTF